MSDPTISITKNAPVFCSHEHQLEMNTTVVVSAYQSTRTHKRSVCSMQPTSFHVYTCIVYHKHLLACVHTRRTCCHPHSTRETKVSPAQRHAMQPPASRLCELHVAVLKAGVSLAALAPCTHARRDAAFAGLSTLHIGAARSCSTPLSSTPHLEPCLLPVGASLCDVTR